jgi:hypothetical protein
LLRQASVQGNLFVKTETEKLPRLPPLPQAFFDEFGANADDRVQDYAHTYALAALEGKDDSFL